jgi:chloramphenicol-sensitive protein RarD
MPHPNRCTGSNLIFFLLDSTWIYFYMNNKGLIYGILAYTMWGVFPLFWHALNFVPASEILVHRIIWSLVFLVILLGVRRQWDWIRQLRNRRTLMILILSACLLIVNWFVYIWAINAGFMIETSLGYFINPLVNVLLGTIFLHEKLRNGQWMAVGIAAMGVLYLTFGYGSFPWIGLSLAFSFGFYGLLKKKVKLGAAEGLTAEMTIVALPALLYFILLESQNQAVFGHSDNTTFILLLSTGVITALPLILFAGAAHRLPLSTLGIIQYITPTLQFIIGRFVFQEPFSTHQLVGFCIIWFALLVYSVEGAYQRRIKLAVAPTPTD